MAPPKTNDGIVREPWRPIPIKKTQLPAEWTDILHGGTCAYLESDAVHEVAKASFYSYNLLVSP